jgi:hypothetical protein
VSGKAKLQLGARAPGQKGTLLMSLLLVLLLVLLLLALLLLASLLPLLF